MAKSSPFCRCRAELARFLGPREGSVQAHTATMSERHKPLSPPIGSHRVKFLAHKTQKSVIFIRVQFEVFFEKTPRSYWTICYCILDPDQLDEEFWYRYVIGTDCRSVDIIPS